MTAAEIWGLIIAGLTAGITFWGIVWLARREDRKAREERTKTVDELQEKRHQENTKRLRRIETGLTYQPPHLHKETTGPLTAEGIHYGPKIPWNEEEEE